MPKRFRLFFGYVLILGCSVARVEAASCVWKVTGANGGIVYLGGSYHLLRSRDYPLPPAYNTAFEASSRLAFEIDPKDLDNSAKMMERAGTYPRGDNLKNHVDPRTYDYLRRFFGLFKVSESQFSKYRPWFLSIALESPEVGGFEFGLGVERYLQRRARANSKAITGLETAREHLAVY